MHQEELFAQHCIKYFVITAVQLTALDVNYSSAHCAQSAFIKFTLQTLKMTECIAHKLDQHDPQMTRTCLFIARINLLSKKVAASTSVPMF